MGYQPPELSLVLRADVHVVGLGCGLRVTPLRAACTASWLRAARSSWPRTTRARRRSSSPESAEARGSAEPPRVVAGAIREHARRVTTSSMGRARREFVVGSVDLFDRDPPVPRAARRGGGRADVRRLALATVVLAIALAALGAARSGEEGRAR